MDTYKGMPYCQTMLYNEDKTLALSIGFLGYSFEAMEKYMSDNFVTTEKAYAGHWAQMKYVGVGREDVE